ncbi:MAG: nitrate/nitrite transporter NrtS [Hyphomonadaceae bacterium]|nr:nitrate/nitrite transporter NrtS [Hyphomonadaceae bacterium]
MLRALIVALVVGTILNVINQGDVLLGEARLNVTRMILTYCIPFCVATYGAWSALTDGRVK